MATELAYALINPYSLAKSRTGGIIARFLSRTGLELAGARMFGPSRELVDEYAAGIRNDTERDEMMRNVLSDYVLRAYAPDPATGRRQRVLLLLFEGDDAIRRIYSVAGSIRPDMEAGETVRDTFGDYIVGADGSIQYVEPAVLVAPDRKTAKRTLTLWARYAQSDGGIIKDARDVEEKNAQQTLVLIKPDNFRFPSSRPGNIIDLFSRSGLRIVGAQVYRMSCSEALAFYGPVQEVLRAKLKQSVADRVSSAINRELGIQVDDAMKEQLGEQFGPLYGDRQFAEIVHFMTGCRIDTCPADEIDKPGLHRSLALIYTGPDAVQKIRSILGPTDPTKADVGTVRRELGQNIMLNAAHASDSVENAQRELKIINVDRDHIKERVDRYYSD